MRQAIHIFLRIGVPLAFFALAGCTEPADPEAECGNGVVEGTEACDSEDFAGETCDSLGAGAGDLSCTSACEIDTSGCVVGEICDNGIDDDGDFRVDCDDVECATEAHCPHCGDGEVNQVEEQCDGADLDGQTCPELGDVACTSECTLDTTGCFAPENCALPGDEDGDGDADCSDSDCTGHFNCPDCGDTIVQQGEVCDGSVPAGTDCATFGGTAGTMSCASDCTWNLDLCVGVELCGTEGDEDFDGDADCDDSDCSTAFNCPECGNGVAQQGEACDDGNQADNDGCLADCTLAQALPAVASELTFTGDFTPSGETATRLFVRPGDNCLVDDPQRTLEYVVYGFRNDSTLPVVANASVLVSEGFPPKTGSLFIYGDDFDPAAPLDNCLTGDEHFTGVHAYDVEVAPGQDIFVVISHGNVANSAAPTYTFTSRVVSSCGDTVRDGDEVCDDGDIDPGTDAGDGCFECTRETDWVCPEDNSGCYPAVCGNGELEPDEDCDDGANVDGDGCTEHCVLEGTTCDLAEDLNRAAFADPSDPVWTWEGDFDDAAYGTEGTGTCTEGAGVDAKAEFTAPEAGDYAFTVASSAAMTLIVREATCDGAELACVNAVLGGGTELVTRTMAASETVTLIAEKAGSTTGSSPFTLKADRYTCGDGRHSAPVEGCDDGNLQSDDGCSSTCQMEFTAESSEPNDSSSTPVPGGGASGTFDPAADVDLFSYTFDATQHTVRYSTSATAPSVCPSFGSVFVALRVLDAGGTEIASSGFTRCPSVTFTPTAGAHSVEVSLNPSSPEGTAYFLWVD